MRWIVTLFIFFLLARAAYSQDVCVSESIRFAQCVDNCLTDKTCSSAKDIFKDACAGETKAYLDCGEINKSAAADKYVRSRLAALKTSTDAGPSPHTLLE